MNNFEISIWVLVGYGRIFFFFLIQIIFGLCRDFKQPCTKVFMENFCRLMQSNFWQVCNFQALSTFSSSLKLYKYQNETWYEKKKIFYKLPKAILPFPHDNIEFY